MVSSGFFVHFNTLCKLFYNILSVFWVKKLSLKQTKKREEKKKISEEFHLSSLTGKCSLPLFLFKINIVHDTHDKR